MFLTYGAYTLPLGAAEVAIARRRELNDAGDPWADRETWTITGMLSNPSGNLGTMGALIASLEAAFRRDGQDLTLRLPSGAESAHVLRSRQTIGGVRVIQPPSYPDGAGAQYVTHRTFQVVLEALILLTPLRSSLKSFTETLQFTGGGPVTDFLEPLVGLPIKQLCKQSSVYRATQSGSAVGLFARPTALLIAPPLWPAHLEQNKTVLTGGSPRRLGDAYIDFPISWQYSFASPVPLSGVPHAWR